MMRALLAAVVLSASVSGQITALGPFPVDGAQSGTGSPATGWGVVTVDAGTNMITWNVQWTGLLGTVSVAHFHAAPAGMNGGVVVGIPTTNPSTGSAAVTPAEVNLFLTGGIYVNIHSSMFPGGEIRGQVVAGRVVINELDADQAGSDAMEFVELYDGGTGNTPLDGLVLVLYNGSADTSYGAYDLSGFSTDANGFFLLGNPAVVPVPQITFPGNGLQNGADAAALYAGSAATFPGGTAVTSDAIIDAVVYDTNDGDDTGLLTVLTPGQPQINEGGGNGSGTDSIGRCVDGQGGPLVTTSWVTMSPTPGASNTGNCNPFQITVTQDIPACGPIVLSVSGASPNAELINLISLTCSFGGGPLFGLGADAWPQLFFPLGAAPFHVNADATGSYTFTAPTGCAIPISVDAISLEVLGVSSILQISVPALCASIAL